MYYRCFLNNVSLQIDRKWMTASFDKFYGKMCIGFCLDKEKKLFRRGFILKPTERAQVPLKNRARDFENNSPYKRSAYFSMTIIGNLKRFHYSDFEISFLKNKKLF